MNSWSNKKKIWNFDQIVGLVKATECHQVKPEVEVTLSDQVILAGKIMSNG